MKFVCRKIFKAGKKNHKQKLHEEGKKLEKAQEYKIITWAKKSHFVPIVRFIILTILLFFFFNLLHFTSWKYLTKTYETVPKKLLNYPGKPCWVMFEVRSSECVSKYQTSQEVQKLDELTTVTPNIFDIFYD